MLLYWDIGISHAFGSASSESAPRDGDALLYGFGMGFAVNSAISLGSAFSGSYVGESVSDGERIPGSATEPMYLSARLNYASRPGLGWQSSVTQGLNDDAGDIEFGFTLSIDL